MLGALLHSQAINIILISIIAILSTTAFYLLKEYDLQDYFNLPKEIRRIRINMKRLQANPENSVLIGTMPGKKPVYIPDDAKHIFVCGTTGSGKTVALSNFIKRAIDNNYGLLIVDGKGDMGDSSILDITQRLARGRKRIYIINLNDPERSDRYNPFQNTNPTMAKDMLINMTDWSEEHYKLNCERYLQRLVNLLVQQGITLSFQNIVDYIPVSRFKLLSMELLKVEGISKEEHQKNVELAVTSGEIAEKASARFSTILESDLKHIFDGDGIDIYTALRENAIILFVLNPLIYPEISPLFGRLVLIDSKKAVSQMFGDRQRKFFIYDEIATYASTALLDLVNKSRSANITCVLSTQSLSDLETVSAHYREQVIENCNNYIVLRQNSSVNAEAWAGILGTRPSMEPTYQIAQKGGTTTETGLGSLRSVRAFWYHPDDIKVLQTGNAIFLSKDSGFHSRIAIHKPF